MISSADLLSKVDVHEVATEKISAATQLYMDRYMQFTFLLQILLLLFYSEQHAQKERPFLPHPHDRE